MWPYALQHQGVMLNAQKQLNGNDPPWKLRFGEDFPYKKIPFGSLVLFWRNPKRFDDPGGKMRESSIEGVFLGYRVQPGFTLREESTSLLHLTVFPAILWMGMLEPREQERLNSLKGISVFQFAMRNFRAFVLEMLRQKHQFWMFQRNRLWRRMLKTASMSRRTLKRSLGDLPPRKPRKERAERAAAVPRRRYHWVR